jgi:hypothetical protein
MPAALVAFRRKRSAEMQTRVARVARVGYSLIMATPTTNREIRVSVRTIDRFSQTRTFKTLAGARKYAQKWVGAHPEQSTFGGVVGTYGDSKVSWSGATYDEMFPSEETGAPVTCADPDEAAAPATYIPYLAEYQDDGLLF